MTAPVQPPPTPPTRRELRPWTDFDRLTAPRREERIATGSALLLALLFHGMMFTWVIPWVGQVMRASRAGTAASVPAAPAKPVEYALAPVTKEDLQALRYVETNPDAPSAKPYHTSNISDRDQRVAQPNPNPDGHSDLPTSNGSTENTTKFIPGSTHFTPAPPPPAPTAQPAPPRPPAPKPTPATAPPVVVATNLPALRGPASSDAGEGVRVSNQPNNATPADQPDNLPPTVETMQRRLPPGPLTPEMVADAADAATPELRPTSASKTFAGPILRNIQGTHVGGLNLGADARLTPFGQYLALLQEAIASAWYAQCEQFTFNPRDWGTEVALTFTLNADGTVADVQVVRSTASRPATQLCLNAITSPAPYPKWTGDMRAQLGDSYTLRFSFFYE